MSTHQVTRLSIWIDQPYEQFRTRLHAAVPQFNAKRLTECVDARHFDEFDLVRHAEDRCGDRTADVGVETAIAAILDGGEACDAGIHAATEISPRLDLLQPARLGLGRGKAHGDQDDQAGRDADDAIPPRHARA